MSAAPPAPATGAFLSHFTPTTRVYRPHSRLNIISEDVFARELAACKTLGIQQAEQKKLAYIAAFL